jgi:hypothetical protein
MSSAGTSKRLRHSEAESKRQQHDPAFPFQVSRGRLCSPTDSSRRSVNQLRQTSAWMEIRAGALAKLCPHSGSELKVGGPAPMWQWVVQDYSGLKVIEKICGS